jgi:serine/threonine-protein kinase
VSAAKICPQCGAEYPLDVRFCQTDGTPLRTQGSGNDLVGSIIAERYHVLRKLGEGGMGQVYLAEHVRMGRKSALKVMNPGMVKDVDAVTRFNREAANASRISHPNVAAVYDFGETPDGVIYLAMEFVDGPPLTKVIESQGSLPPQRAAEIVRQAADALAVAHDMGIVHRDLKPDNIMLATTRDGGDLVKVVDFGIAKAAGADAQKVTRTGLVVGTPEYMSPEQLAGDKLDGRSDIYSLALVAFNMLTGTLPFPSDSTQESMIMRLTDKPQPLQAMKSDVPWPAEVQRVMDRALERQASARYASAPEFARDLVRAVERMPDTAAREAGTQVIAAPSAVPAAGTVAMAGTVVVPGAAAAAGGDGAGGVPATRVGSAAQPAGGGHRGIVFGGVGLVVAAGIAFAALSLHKPTSGVQGPAAAASASDSIRADSSLGATPQGAAEPVGGSSATSAPARQPDANAAANTDPPKSAASAKPPMVQLADLEGAVKADTTKTGAQRILTRLNTVTLTTKDETAHADYIRFRAYETLDPDLERACPNLKQAIEYVTDPFLKARWTNEYEICSPDQD